MSPCKILSGIWGKKRKEKGKEGGKNENIAAMPTSSLTLLIKNLSFCEKGKRKKRTRRAIVHLVITGEPQKEERRKIRSAFSSGGT